MKNYVNSIICFLKEEDGPTAVEYAVMTALIIAVCVGAISTLGTETKGTFDEASAALGN